jgi:hypothetical protein
MSDDDVAYRRFIVGTIVDKEMACQDDHWNDEMRTRPDVSWQGRFHKSSDLVEFCGRPYEKDRDGWINAYIEAEDIVIELRRSGHARARGILDLPNEMAYTCDNCRLWGFVGHIDKHDAFSEEERGGALFLATTCDPDAVRKTFGKPFDPNSAWDRDGHYIEDGADEKESHKLYNKNSRKRNRQKEAEYSFYWRRRKKEEINAEPTS